MKTQPVQGVSSRLSNPAEIHAAIDIGTNSAHLAVGVVDTSSGLQLIDADKIALQLGKEIDEDGLLNEAAIERACRGVSALSTLARSYTKSIRIVATHAARVARNSNVLIERLSNAAQCPVEIIDGLEEGRLTYLGISAGIPLGKDNCLAVDIGGGSTEFILARGPNPQKVISLPIGAVTLTAQFLKDERPSDNDLSKLRKFIKEQLKSIPPAFLRKFDLCVMSSGTAKSLAAMDSYLHHGEILEDLNGHWILRNDVEKIVKRLEELRTPRKIKARFDLSQSRSDIILAGAIIVDEILKHLELEDWIYSSFSLREGLIIDRFQQSGRTIAMDESGYEEVLWQAVNWYGADVNQARRVLALSIKIFHELYPHCFPSEDRDEKLYAQGILRSAAILHEIGRSIHYSNYNKHSAYLVSQKIFPGFFQEEKFLIAYTILGHRGSSTPEDLPWPRIYYQNEDLVRVLAACLRLACSAVRTRSDDIPDMKFKFVGGEELIHIELSGNHAAAMVAVHRVTADIKQLSKMLKKNISATVRNIK